MCNTVHISIYNVKFHLKGQGRNSTHRAWNHWSVMSSKLKNDHCSSYDYQIQDWCSYTLLTIQLLRMFFKHFRMIGISSVSGITQAEKSWVSRYLAVLTSCWNAPINMIYKGTDRPNRTCLTVRLVLPYISCLPASMKEQPRYIWPFSYIKDKYTLFFKRNATFLDPFFPVTLGHWPSPRVMNICQMVLRVTCKNPVAMFLMGLSQS